MTSPRFAALLVLTVSAACRHTPSAGTSPSASNPIPAASTPAPSVASAPAPLAIRSQADCPEGMVNITQPILGAKDDTPRQQHFQVASFCIDRTEVPRPKWRNDLCGPTDAWGCLSTVSMNVPMVCIDHEQADCYCARATAGVAKRLPSDPEWLLAAYGTDGRTSPWGNDYPKDVILGQNFCPLMVTLPGEASLCPVEQNVLDRSPYGVIGMETNGMEMTGSCARIEAAPEAPFICLIRGGETTFATVPIRGPAGLFSSLGFRCVVSERRAP
jgi:hypothetical protein